MHLAVTAPGRPHLLFIGLLGSLGCLLAARGSYQLASSALSHLPRW
jgi:hypothetical protein